MGLRDALRFAGRALVGAMDVQPGGVGYTMLQGVTPGGVGQPPKRGTRELLAAYEQMPWLRAVTSRIGAAVASAEWKLYTKSGAPGETAKRFKTIQRADHLARRKFLLAAQHDHTLREIETHPLLDTLDSANPFQTGRAMRQITINHIDLVGEAFWMKERNGLGMPVSVWPIPPSWIMTTPTPSQRTFRVSWRGWQGEIPDTEILWFLDPDPANPFGRGSGIAMSLSDELETDEYAAKHTRAMFYNRARPDIIVTAEGLSQPDTRRLEMDWMAKNRGFWQAFKPYFLNKKVEVTQLDTTDLRSMQFTQLREAERDIIVHVFGVPPEILGILENSNRATIDAADYLFASYVVQPRLEFLRSYLQERLVPEYDERLILDYESPVKEDAEFALKVAATASWSRTVDEWRTAQGLDELPNGHGKVIMVPLGATPTRLEDLSAPPPAPAPAPTPAPTPPPASAATPSGPKEAALLREDADVLQEAQVVAISTPERWAEAAEVARVLRVAAADDLLDLAPVARIAAKLEPKMRQAFLAAVEAAKGRIDVVGLADAVVSGALGHADALLQLDAMTADLEPATRLILQHGFTEGAALTAELLAPYGISVAFDLVNAHAVRWAETQAGQLILGVTDQAQRALRWLMATGMQDGRTVRQLAVEFQQWFGLTQRQYEAVYRFRVELEQSGAAADVVARKVDRYAQAQLRYRALTIARTETQTAAHQGQLALWEEGVRQGTLDPATTRRQWIVTHDDRLDRKVCAKMDEDEVPYGQPFTLPDGQKLMMPPAHPNCRCSVGLVFTRR